ncbi:MAG: response regulator transcription factor, partial [Proteobacteria bacterium]
LQHLSHRVEDDPGSQFVLEETLGLRYKIQSFDSLATLDRALLQTMGMPNLLIADLRLGDGISVDYLKNRAFCNQPPIPFLVISSLDDLDFLREAYRTGALDYIAKPFTKNELIAKVERALNLLIDQPESSAHAASARRSWVTIDGPRLRVVGKNGEFVSLTAKEFKIFSLLYHAGVFVSRATMLEDVWGDVQVDAKVLDVHVFNLRRKLKTIDLKVAYHSENGFGLEQELIAHHSLLNNSSDLAPPINP